VYQETSLFGPLSIAENIFSWGPPHGGRAGHIGSGGRPHNTSG
jgi:hypothetical protein